MAEKISAAEAKTHLSELLSKVKHERRRYLIERRGKPIAAIVGIDELEAIEQREKPKRMGLLALIDELKGIPGPTDEEMDEFVKGIYQRRRESTPRAATFEDEH